MLTSNPKFIKKRTIGGDASKIYCFHWKEGDERGIVINQLTLCTEYHEFLNLAKKVHSTTDGKTYYLYCDFVVFRYETFDHILELLNT